mmetsp:Transcript_23586/g.52294  ORF Transcript_23586/g.52294 Transcript_23586/m.52294 type:complete len:85 (+) Transcript_23586:141-395(+)
MSEKNRHQQCRKTTSILKVRQKREPTFFPRGKEPTSKGDVIKNRHHFAHAQKTDISNVGVRKEPTRKRCARILHFVGAFVYHFL